MNATRHHITPVVPRAPRFLFLLVVAHKRLQSWVQAHGDGTTAARSGLLMAVRDDPVGTPLADVGRALDLGPSSLSGLVDRMADSGLVERIPDPADRRAWRLVLTDRGRGARKAAVDRAADLNARLCAGFTDDELAVVARWLDRIRHDFPREDG